MNRGPSPVRAADLNVSGGCPRFWLITHLKNTLVEYPWNWSSRHVIEAACMRRTLVTATCLYLRASGNDVGGGRREASATAAEGCSCESARLCSGGWKAGWQKCEVPKIGGTPKNIYGSWRSIWGPLMHGNCQTRSPTQAQYMTQASSFIVYMGGWV